MFGEGAPDMEMMMKDPRFKSLLIQLMQQRKAQQGGAANMLQGGGTVANLGKQLPKLQQIQEQWKLEDAKRKAKKLELDMIMRQAEAQAQQQQTQAAQQSV